MGERPLGEGDQVELQGTTTGTAVCARRPSIDEHRCEVIARLLAAGVSPRTLRVLIPEWESRLSVNA